MQTLEVLITKGCDVFVNLELRNKRFIRFTILVKINMRQHVDYDYNNNNTAFILRHISGHCGHLEAHYKHLHIINNIMIKMHTVKMQDKI